MRSLCHGVIALVVLALSSVAAEVRVGAPIVDGWRTLTAQMLLSARCTHRADLRR